MVFGLVLTILNERALLFEMWLMLCFVLKGVVIVVRMTMVVLK